MEKLLLSVLLLFWATFPNAQTISDDLTWVPETSNTSVTSPVFESCTQVTYTISSTIGFKNVTVSGNQNLTNGLITPGYIYDPTLSIPMTITFVQPVYNLRIRFDDLDGPQHESIESISPPYSGMTNVIGHFFDPGTGSDAVDSDLENARGWITWNGPVTSISFNYIRPSEGCGLVIDSLRFMTECTTTTTTPHFAMPNVFSPDNDGINDIFMPINTVDITTFNQTIINRWGEVVFQSSDINNNWSGRFNNNDCTEGVYFWKIEYTDSNGLIVNQDGFLQLVR